MYLSTIATLRIPLPKLLHLSAARKSQLRLGSLRWLERFAMSSSPRAQSGWHSAMSLLYVVATRQLSRVTLFCAIVPQLILSFAAKVSFHFTAGSSSFNRVQVRFITASRLRHRQQG